MQQPRRQPRRGGATSGPRIHFVYWEGGDPSAVRFAGGGPSLCRQCRGVSRPWRYRTDNLQACIRSCGKEGAIFRQEVAAFVCLSPCMAGWYNLQHFGSWLVIGTPRLSRRRPCLGPPSALARARSSRRSAAWSARPSRGLVLPGPGTGSRPICTASGRKRTLLVVACLLWCWTAMGTSCSC
ncbi:unnamed protein product [Prorocentrum cordatum]|uniref:Uncharacterized protein n=1 Tax=Prorocentrum cordatum TaxID=2364126 RepID=A0ABN9T2B9_9DINO|nr:unnamed protein product [Polarella glacialis]